MIEKIIRCDHCNKENAKSYIVVTGKEMDSSGIMVTGKEMDSSCHGYVEVTKFYDFCFSCLINYVRKNTSYKIFERKI